MFSSSSRWIPVGRLSAGWSGRFGWKWFLEVSYNVISNYMIVVIGIVIVIILIILIVTVIIVIVIIVIVISVIVIMILLNSSWTQFLGVSYHVIDCDMTNYYKIWYNITLFSSSTSYWNWCSVCLHSCHHHYYHNIGLQWFRYGSWMYLTDMQDASCL